MGEGERRKGVSGKYVQVHYVLIGKRHYETQFFAQSTCTMKTKINRRIMSLP